MRVLYMGSPLEAIPPLQKLCELQAQEQIELVAVVSKEHKQPDLSSVAGFALERGLRLFCPLRASSVDFIKQLQDLNIDVILTAAYGQLLSSDFLTLAKRATINIHPSLLPRHRGASPVPAALLAGDQETGVTICFTVQALDAGNIILQEQMPIPPHTNHKQLLKHLFELGANLLPAALQQLQDPSFIGMPQDKSLITTCYKIKRRDGGIDWHWQAKEIYRRYLAFSHWPEIFTYWNGRRVVLKKVGLAQQEKISGLDARSTSPSCGEFVCADDVLQVQTGEGILNVHTLQVEGKAITSASAFANRVRQQGCYRFALDTRHV